MNHFKIFLIILFSLLLSFSYVSAKEIITSVEITNVTLSDPLTITSTPYISIKQDLYETKIDTIQFTKVDDLTLGDRIEFEVEEFDFTKKTYSKASHNVVMASVKPSDALVYIYSDPIQTVLIKGVIKDFDISGNGQNDLRLRYDGINSETGYGILNMMRYNRENYKIYGNTFCERKDVNTNFSCVEVTDKNLGTYKEIVLDKYVEIDAKAGLTDEAKLVEKITESLKNETTIVSVSEPVKEPEKSIGDYINIKVIVFIAILIMLIAIYFVWKKRMGNSGAEIDFGDD